MALGVFIYRYTGNLAALVAPEKAKEAMIFSRMVMIVPGYSPTKYRSLLGFFVSYM